MPDTAVITAVISALALILVAQVKRAGDKEAGRAPDWQAYVQEQRADVASLRSDLNAVRGEVQELRTEVRGLQVWKGAALNFIRELMDQVPSHKHPPVPHELRDDISAPAEPRARNPPTN
ncbi:hypothetical protein ACTXK0_05175 [Corynebacterium variabile]|uniref:hypothetical protein n=1 Tax=Corynebacterium variabile TaxID=1727 RepID=UPI003FD541EE